MPTITAMRNRGPGTPVMNASAKPMASVLNANYQLPQLAEMFNELRIAASTEREN
jgi:hypothetical protein